MFLAGSCGSKRSYKFDEGEYALRMIGETCVEGRGPKTSKDTDIVTVTRNGEQVLMRMAVPELPASFSVPPQVKEQLAAPIKGTLTENRFACRHANSGITNEFEGRLVDDNRLEGTFTVRLPNGTLHGKGTWTLEPTRRGE
jgi:hypothetical protein